MKRFGLIGNPISTSRSPVLFNAGYGGKYTYDLIEGADFETSYDRFLEDYHGINVTAPFKEAAFRKADLAEESCARMKATNLLVKTEEGVKAYNTDFYGIELSVLDGIFPGGGFAYFQEHGVDMSVARKCILKHFGHQPQALVAGCGGAGRAAAAAMGELGCSTVLMNRTIGKAVKIALEIPDYPFRTEPIEAFVDVFRQSDIIIYTIPSAIPDLSRIHDAENRPLDDKNRIHDAEREGFAPRAGQEKLVIEANYKDPSIQGQLLQDLRNDGYICIPGKKWLLYQALTGYGIFTGEEPDFERMCKDFQ